MKSVVFNGVHQALHFTKLFYLLDILDDQFVYEIIHERKYPESVKKTFCAPSTLDSL
jgi:hypothetical protein